MINLIDEFDSQILKQLEIDGRIAYSAIARTLGVSNTLVHQRVLRLMENGLLTGIKPMLDEKKMGYDWGTFTGITFEKGHDSNRIIEMLKNIPEVTECYYITGAHALHIKVVAKNHEHMRWLLSEKIDNIPGIAKTDSIVELGCAFKRSIIG